MYFTDWDEIMEIRKVQVTGGSSYTISLPKSWVKSLNIKKNDPLGMIIQPDMTLLITPNIDKKEVHRKIEFDADHLSEPEHLFRCLIGAYISGYTIIRIKSNKSIPPAVRAAVRKFTHQAIGQEVVEETPTSITIKDILNPEEMPFENSIKRMYVIVRGMHRDVINALKNRDRSLAEDVIARDDEVDRLHWLIARQQNIISKDLGLAQRMGIAMGAGTNYFLISKIIERIGDHAVRIAKNVVDLIDKDLDEKIVHALEVASNLALEMFDKSIRSFFEEDLEAVNKNIESLSRLASRCRDIDTLILQYKGGVAISVSQIVESIKRTGEYSADLSEYAINYLIEKHV